MSAKTTKLVPVKCCLVWDALVQATLDPQVLAIEYVESAHVHCAPIQIDAIILQRQDGRVLLDVVPARTVRDIDAEGLVLMALAAMELPTLYLDAEDIRREPLCANSKTIWNYRLHSVDIRLRLNVLSILMDGGPMPLSHLIQAIHSDRDPGPAVMAMACSSLVEIDLADAPLGPATIVRCRA